MSDEWVMVPREPTEAMFSASSFQEWDTFEQEWRAMLYAAPAAPAQQAGPVAWVDVHDRDEGPYEFHGRKLLPAGQHELFLHPPAAEVQGGFDFREECDRRAHVIAYLMAEVHRFRDAAKDVCEWADAAQWALGNETGVPAAKLDALRKALEGGE